MNLRKQRLTGAALTVISWLLLFLTAASPTPEKQDAAAALMLLPVGLYLIFTDEDMIS